MLLPLEVMLLVASMSLFLGNLGMAPVNPATRWSRWSVERPKLHSAKTGCGFFRTEL